MADKYAGLTLGVDVSQVTNAVKSLQQFKKANDDAKSSVEGFVDTEAIARQQAKQLAEELRRQRAEFRKIQDSIDPTAAKMDKLRQAASQLDSLWKKGVVPDDTFFELGAILETQQNKLIATKKALTEEGRAAAEEAKQKARAEAEARKFISALQQQAEAAGKTREELLEIRAAQLGVSAEAAPFISQMKAQDKQAQKLGISMGQYRQAMRMLPAQITDVVTSLASGMPVWLVAIQQGGQIKDSFGGISNTFKALLSYLNPVNVGVGALVVSLGALVKAGYDSYSSQRNLHEALVLTGGYAGTNAAQFEKMAQDINSSTNATIGSIRNIATELARSGKFTITQIRAITKTTAQWSAVTGESSGKITEYFNKIADDPVKGLAKLNEEFNFLKQGQLTYIADLEKTSGKTAAVTRATELFADVMEQRLANLADSATPLEKMWDDVRKWASDAWGWVGDHTIGALNLITDVVAATVEQVRYLLNQGDILIGEFVISATKAMQNIPGLSGVGDEFIKQQQEIIDKSKKENEELAKSIEERDARVRKGEMGYIEMMRERAATEQQYSEKTREAIRKEAEELAKRDKARSQKVKVSAGDRIEDQYQRDIVALETQLRVLKEHETVIASISQQRRALWTEQAKIQVLQEASQKRQLTDEEKSIIANKDKILSLAEQRAILGDQIQLQDTSIKFLHRQKETLQSLELQQKGMSDRETQRELERQRIVTDWLAKGGQLTDARLAEMIDKINEVYAMQDELSMNSIAGIERSTKNWIDSAMDLGGQFGNVMTNALNGISDQFVELLSTGKSSFKDFASSIIKMIMNIITQLSIAYAIQAAMGWVSGSPKTGGGSGQSFPVPSFRPRGFSDGGYTGDGGKYEAAGVVHKGEFVMTKEATKRIGVGNLYKLMRGYANGGVVGGSSYSGGGINAGAAQFNIGGISVDINNGSDPKGIETGVKMIFTDMIKRSCTQGGEVYEFVMSKRG
ncbi:tail length tape-measure protein [Escherichia phage Jahat_MG145]|uniref:Tape measure protein n=1 Tax=Escherichia phage Jahat_MG145 TaxID=2562601 RepID=A0A4D6DYH2_9CAUD|nr:tail length tape-measure protein [Escherichia phage Jahat_MG145]